MIHNYNTRDNTMTTPHLYTVERVAELLNLHVKTVRGYVRSGRLKARRIGKQYRIPREDLEEFTGTSLIDKPPAVARTRHVIVSAIVDADAVPPEVADRISTTVMAGLNAKRGEGDAPRVDVIYFPEQGKLRITITAPPDVTTSLLRLVNALLEG
jgi:excisionase family DNA binding protein